MSSELTWSRYGKDKVRIFRIVRDGKIHHVVEYNVCALLEGDVDTSYTEADNSVVVATDSSTPITLAPLSDFADSCFFFSQSKILHIVGAFYQIWNVHPLTIIDSLRQNFPAYSQPREICPSSWDFLRFQVRAHSQGFRHCRETSMGTNRCGSRRAASAASPFFLPRW